MSWVRYVASILMTHIDGYVKIVVKDYSTVENYMYLAIPHYIENVPLLTAEPMGAK